MEKVSIFWFRRDLRLKDNTGLEKAMQANTPVMPVFIFDPDIIDTLPRQDKRLAFIHFHLSSMKEELERKGSSLLVLYDKPVRAFKMMLDQYTVEAVYANGDYEPYAIQRDTAVKQLMEANGVPFFLLKDQVIFEKNEILKPDGKPYIIFTPYMKRWIEKYNAHVFDIQEYNLVNLYQTPAFPLPNLKTSGFADTGYIPSLPEIDHEIICNYDKTRNIPGISGTSRLGVHLRFGTVSVRQVASIAYATNKVFLNEMIWREFFMSILYHFPQVQYNSFKKQYDRIEWRNNTEEFNRWCNGQTGFPIVDAGMRELNATGFMHNRVRMIAASFLTKDLLIDWRWGEAYFAEKLLDYELSSNNGNWQWVAGTGCDAAPYFRIFNPVEQARKFDAEQDYIRQWVPEAENSSYPPPMVDHHQARERTLQAYKKALHS